MELLIFVIIVLIVMYVLLWPVNAYAYPAEFNFPIAKTLINILIILIALILIVKKTGLL